MENETKLKRVLGFGATCGAAMGLVVSGTAMFSVTQVAGQASHAVWITALSIFISAVPPLRVWNFNMYLTCALTPVPLNVITPFSSESPPPVYSRRLLS